MRHILIDRARRKRAARNGGLRQRITLQEAAAASHEESSVDVIALDTALTRLAKIDGRQSRIVELRYFGGLSIDETAEALGISSKTVKRDWAVARAWLHREIGERGAP
jgi:RNA polymerase sigma factor (TIGR02999 family)